MELPYEYLEIEAFEKGFAKHYKKHIVPLSQAREPERKKRKIRNRFSIALAVMTGVVGFKMILKSSWFLKSHARKKGNILLMPFILAWWLFVRRPNFEYFSASKEQIVPEILKFFGEYKYQPIAAISEDIIDLHRTYHGIAAIIPFQDLIEYEKDGNKILIQERTTKEFKQYVGVLMIMLDLKKDLGINMLIHSQCNAHDGTRYNHIRRLRRFKKPHQISPEVDAKFKVFSNNQERAKRMICDHFIAELKELNMVFERENLLLSIVNNKVFLELNTQHNLLEIGNCYDNPIANANSIKNFLKELHYIFGLADRLSQMVDKE